MKVLHHFLVVSLSSELYQVKLLQNQMAAMGYLHILDHDEIAKEMVSCMPLDWRGEQYFEMLIHSL